MRAVVDLELVNELLDVDLDRSVADVVRFGSNFGAVFLFGLFVVLVLDFLVVFFLFLFRFLDLHSPSARGRSDLQSALL